MAQNVWLKDQSHLSWQANATKKQTGLYEQANEEEVTWFH